jgi:GAF domain-containing protein
MTPDPLDHIVPFAELSQIKLGDTDLQGVLSRVAELARNSIPGAGEVSVTLVRDQVAQTAAFTGPLALALDERQYADRQGPCLAAAVSQTTITIDDLALDSRWPGWAAKAVSAGARSSLAIGLPVREKTSGALNVYAPTPAAFDEEAVLLAEAFAGYAAVALANAHLYDTTTSLAMHMQKAMEHRSIIEQAKGIIMAEYRCTADQAFAILTKTSQDSNRKLRDIAATLVEKAATGKP